MEQQGVDGRVMIEEKEVLGDIKNIMSLRGLDFV